MLKLAPRIAASKEQYAFPPRWQSKTRRILRGIFRLFKCPGHDGEMERQYPFSGERLMREGSNLTNPYARAMVEWRRMGLA
jgi:hypothetical protein